jgi:ribosomal-protein-alanine N-acetyltransferase
MGKFGRSKKYIISMKLNFPEITDGVVHILNFSESHLNQKYVSWLNDIEVVRFSEQRHIKHTLKSCQRYYEDQKNSNNYFLAIELTGEKARHIGNLGISVNYENKIADLSIIIGDKSSWGSGAGSRAWSLALNTLLYDLNFRIVTAGTMEVNKPMINLMKRSGMSIDGILPARFLFEGNEVGLVAASIINKDQSIS